MKKYLLSIAFILVLCSAINANPKFIAKGSQNIQFNDISVYPYTVYNDDIKLTFNKNGSGIICFLKFDTYIRQLPIKDYTDYNKIEEYEAIYSPSENLLIIRRIICNFSNETWNPGIRTKLIKWYLVR